MNNTMAELLFGNITITPDEIEARYPERDLPEGAVVTRFAPSPTGFLHFGGLFAAFTERLAARSTNGVFFLRIEDTDKKREVADGVSKIVEGLAAFGVDFDEGQTSETEEKGNYGPYMQSKRTDIYQMYVKELVKQGLAYPCFMSEEELAQIRSKQEAAKELPGIYGSYAKYRSITPEEAEAKIKAGCEYVLRLKSPGSPDKRISFKDAIKGNIEMPENIMDVVLLKKDGTPTYHFAHAVDDHLMRTTHAMRGDEWISSVPIHIQLFKLLGFKVPKYVHISPIMKEENGGKRKLSKRKDPEAAVSFYDEQGYPVGSVWEYLLTLANSNYEDWRRANPNAPCSDFPFQLSKMSKAGALFDIAKLNDISKTYISTLSAENVYEAVCQWAKKYDTEFFELLTKDEKYSLDVLAIERGNAKPRKDIAKWDEVRSYWSYMYDELWDEKYDFPENLSNADMAEILEKYAEIYNPELDNENWFAQVRELAESLGYAKTPKLYKQSPDEYKGHVGDVSSVIRVAVTGRKNTPDLCSILSVLGYERSVGRIKAAIEYLKAGE